MVLMTSVLAIVTLVGTTVDYVQAHGYIKDPKPSWKTKPTSMWIVEIDPQWKGGWEHNDIMVTFKKLAAVNNFTTVRALMDGNPVYGEDCGFTDPNGTPVDPPSNGMATFSRGIVHPGPCEIHLDDKMVFQSDNCASTCGDGTLATISTFKPIDYLLCPPGGCSLRFYWLALQRFDGVAKWQAYKDCIRLTGPPGGGASQTSQDVSQKEPSDDSHDKKSDEKPPAKDSQTKDSQHEPKDSQTKDSKETKDSHGTPPAKDSPETPPANDSHETPPAGETPETPTPTPEMTPAPSSKCTGHRRRRH